MINKL